MMDLGGSIDSYLTLPGDQVVVVPNGRYTAGDVEDAAHAATDGPLKGWLVLEAQTQGGVTVDQGPAPLTVGEHSSRILFVGFKFINGPTYVEGQHIAFWYTDHSFNAYTWNAVQHKKYAFPHTIEAYDSTTDDAAFYGVDAHDTGHAFDLSHSSNVLIEGTHVYNIDDMGQDPGNTIHLDSMEIAQGGSRNLTITDSWFQGHPMIEDGRYGAVTGLKIDNTWLSDSQAAGLQYTSDASTNSRGVFGEMTNDRIFGYYGNCHCWLIETIDGQMYVDNPNTQPGRINVVERNLTTDPPPAGTPDPASVWRQAHPYNDWMYAIH